MPQLLLELLSEEIPARMQAQAGRDLERLMLEQFAAAGLLPEATRAFAGPRRLTFVAEGLPVTQPDRSEERKGPRTSAPDQALQGFLRSTGLTREQLTERDGVFFANLHRPGRPTAEIIAEAAPAVLRAFPWPKSMRSGASAFRWVRPLKRILAVFGDEVVAFEVGGVASGDLTEGHRFHGARGAPFRARDWDAYAAGLEREHVVLDPEERKRGILEGARTLCFARGLELVDDPGLLDEVAGLAEWPTPVLGDMDPAFLDLPPEVIRTSMRTHQKYFAVRAAPSTPETDTPATPDPKPATPALAPHFVTVANIEAADGGSEIARGNAKVLSARLSDARYFWDIDRASGFEPWLEKLKGVTFHAKLGTLAERAARIEALAVELAPLVGADVELTREAARLCKADLASAMVGEFPELQGVMGGYYARGIPFSPSGRRWREAPDEGALATSSGIEDDPPNPSSDPLRGPPSPARGEGADAIADAIRDHYRPQGPSDAVPTAPVTVAVALADKLDTLVGFFAIDEKPTGSRDPYALRRAALGVIRIVLETKLRLSLREPLRIAGTLLITARKLSGDTSVSSELLGFFADRLKVLLREQGRRHDLVDAVFALGDDDLVRIVARVEALSGFLATEDGENLLAGYRRAANILKAELKKGGLPEGGWAAHPAAAAEERALAAALGAAQVALEPALEAEDFTGAMAALARLRAPVDAFFDKVLVNDPEPETRAARLRLLAGVQAAMNRVADFSLING